MSGQLLLFSQKPEDLALATEVAQIAQLSLKAIANLSEAGAVLAAEEPSVVFVDCADREQYMELERSIQEKLGLFSEKINPNFIHFISPMDLNQLHFLLASPIFGHYIHRSFSKDPSSAGRRYGRIVRATLQERVFGLERLLPEGARIQTVRFNKTTEKQDGVEAVRNFLLATKFKSRMATVIANAVDELIMNAMFDAPVDELGKPLFIATPRDAEMDLSGKRLVEMSVGFDGEFVGICAMDLYGSLDKAKLFAHIAKRYVEEEYQVRQAIAGAGIGLATVFRSGGSFLFSSEPRVRTEVTVFFRRTDNFREFKEQFRFISTQFYF